MMNNKIWYDVVEFNHGCRDIVFSTKDKDEALDKANKLNERHEGKIGVIITVNRLKDNTFKRLENIIVNESKEVKKHFDFLKSIDNGLIAKKETKKKKKHHEIKKEYHF